MLVTIISPYPRMFPRFPRPNSSSEEQSASAYSLSCDKSKILTSCKELTNPSFQIYLACNHNFCKNLVISRFLETIKMTGQSLQINNALTKGGLNVPCLFCVLRRVNSISVI